MINQYYAGMTKLIKYVAKPIDNVVSIAISALFTFYALPTKSGTTACTTDEKFEDIFRDRTRGEIYQCATKRGVLDLADEIDVRIQEAPFRIPHGYQQCWFQAQLQETGEDGDYVATIFDTGV